MEVKFSPTAVDEPNLLYKLQRKVKVVGANALPNRGYNLLDTATKFGLVFIAFPEGVLSVYYLKDLCDKECETPMHLSVPLQEKPTHISVSCDEEFLAITGGHNIYIYKISEFQNQNVVPGVTIPCNVPSPQISSLQWNPCIPDMIAVAYFDGTLLVSSALTNQVKIIPAKARCICWSPKGKQVVVGNNDGTLCQYKPDLSLMKTVPAPQLFDGAPIECLAIHWVSTYQFVVVYKTLADGCRPAVTIVNTPKGGKPTCMNYDDICYSMGGSRPWYYYLLGIPQWNMILAASSNSMEVATLGSADNNNWIHWCPTDEARAELPLSGKDDNYPVGITVDTTALYQLPWGENQTLPHMPLLLVLSHTGLLVIFNIINMNNNSPQLCVPTQPIGLPAAAMTSAIPGEEANATAPAPASQSVAQPEPPLQQAQAQVMSPPALPSFSAFSSSLTSGMPKLPEYEELPRIDISSLVPAQISIPQPQVQSILNQDISNQLAGQSTLPPTTLPSKAPQTPQTLTPTAEQNAHKIKEDKERAAIKANKELTSMLIKEVNDFQTELYNFMTTSFITQAQLSKEVDTSEPTLDLSMLNTETLKRDCSLEEVRTAVVQLKLELVRTCAVVAEGRTYDESKELQQCGQPDLLTTKRITSICNRIYHVEMQLDQAQKALDYEWTQLSRDDYNDKRTPRMIRPILDDVYYPLVKQQAILSRQEAVLKALKNTLKQCDSLPWKTSLLRSTPFKKDTLSNLSKNLLNMSIEPQNNNNLVSGLTTQKLDALRDMLADHKTVRIKPVNVELRQHYATLRSKYEKTLKDKVVKQQNIKQINEASLKEEKDIKPVAAPPKAASPIAVPPVSTQPITSPPISKIQQVNTEIKPDITKFGSPVLPSKTAPTSGIANVARTLFTDEPERPAITIPKPVPTVNTASSTSQTSVLKDLLQSKPSDSTNANTFLGLKICSPSSVIKDTKTQFGGLSQSLSTNSFAPTSVTDNKWSTSTPLLSSKSQSAETGESEALQKNEKKSDSTITVTVKKPEPKEEKSIFATKPVSLFGSAQAQKIPDIVRTEPKSEAEAKILTKPVAQSAKVSEKVSVVIDQKSVVVTSTENKQSMATISTLSSQMPSETKEDTLRSPLNSTITSNANQTASGTKVGSVFATPASPASGSMFGSKLSSIFSPTTTTTPEVSISIISKPSEHSTKQVFGAATTTSSVFSVPTPKSIFETAQPSSIQSPSVSTDTLSPVSTVTARTTDTTSTSVFGSTVSSTPTSAFGSSVTTQSSIFDITTTKAFSTSTAAFSVFGSSTSTTQPSVFSSSLSATQPSVFSASSSTAQPVFSASSSTTQPSVFGSHAVLQASANNSSIVTQPSIFSSPTPPTTNSIFGTSTTVASVFDSATPTAKTSVFGSPNAQSSIFGTPTPTQSSIFGSTTNTTQASVFGSQTTRASIFGTSNEGRQSSPFGGAEANLFASASISPSSVSSNNAGNIFSSSNTSGGSIFGGGSVFGSSNTFGQKPASNIFGGGNTYGQNNASSSIWGTSTTSSSGFGSSFSQPTQAQSVFGSGSFSATVSPGQAFANPAQTAGPFGTPQQQSSPTFGAGPVFGAKPVFGQSTGFGSSAGGFGSFSSFNKSPSSGFGGAATFGGSAFGSTSPGSSVFGSTSPSSAFGQPTQSNMTFENLATQNTIGFGNLAQQSAQQQPARSQPFNTSPSFTGWRG